MRSRLNLILGLGLATLSFAAAVGVSVTQPGCTGSECTYDEKRPDMPSPSIECAAGDVCYLGACFRSCNSGAERTTPCNTDSDCKDPGQPKCVLADVISGSFCSTCDEGESCVLGLNVCRPVSDIPDPPDPGMPTFMLPPVPLDGGQIDATTFETDAGEESPGEVDDTYVGSILIEEQVNLPRNDGGLTREPFACVDFADVRSATVAVPESVLLSRGDCDLRQPRLFRSRANLGAAAGPANACARRQRPPQYPEGVVSSNIGNVTFAAHPDTMEAMPSAVTLAFDPGSARYAVSTPSPLLEPMLRLSIPRMGMTRSVDRYVTLVGTAEPGVSEAWPSNREGDLINLPYELKLSPLTLERLSRPIEIQNPPVDLELTWERLTVNAAVPGARMEVNVFSTAAPYVYIHCEVEEDTMTEPRIRIVGEMFREFRTRAGAGLPAELPISIGRTIEKRLSINGEQRDGGVAPDAGIPRNVINGRLNVSHTYLGTLRF